ncbi:MAG: GNAT family N-acetyltransferase [Bacteroidota bacterium]
MKALTQKDVSSFFQLLQANKGRLEESFPNLLISCSSSGRTAQFIRNQIVLWSQQQKFAFGLHLRKQPRMIGYVSVKSIDWKIPKCEMAYFIDKDFAGKGHMSEAVKALTEYCFEELDMVKLFARIMPHNLASQALAAKVGFSKEATLRKDFRTHNNQLVDIQYWSILSED